MKNQIEKLFSSPNRLESLYGVRKLYKDIGSKNKKSLAFTNIVQALKTKKQKSYKPTKEVRKFFFKTAEVYKIKPMYSKFVMELLWKKLKVKKQMKDWKKTYIIYLGFLITLLGNGHQLLF